MEELQKQQAHFEQQLNQAKALGFDAKVAAERAQAENTELRNLVTKVAQIAGFDTSKGVDVQQLFAVLQDKFQVVEAEPVADGVAINAEPVKARQRAK